MSFAKLKSSRREKETRSFVTAHAAGKQENTVGILPHTEPQTADVLHNPENTSQEPTSHPVSLRGVYQNIPDTLEVRKSEETGRGVYAKAQYHVGS